MQEGVGAAHPFFMFQFDFIHKLRKCNSLFYIGAHATIINEAHSAASLMLRRSKRDIQKVNLNYAGQAAEYLQASQAGQVDEFICGVPVGELPEYDVFDNTTGRLLARGWRSTLCILAKKRVVSLDTARRVFNHGGIGLDEYDKLDMMGKLSWSRGERYAKR